jgi:acyl carrier protein
MTDTNNRAALLLALKELIVDECEKDVAAESITDDEALFGGPLDLDSLDALQLSMAIKRVYDVRIQGNTAARKALASVNTLADIVLKKSPCFAHRS